MFRFKQTLFLKVCFVFERISENAELLDGVRGVVLLAVNHQILALYRRLLSAHEFADFH